MSEKSLIVRQGNRVLDLSFEADISSIAQQLPEFVRQRIPSITRNALNDTVEEARFAEIAKIKGVFDRPVPLTERAPLYRRATKDYLVAEVFIRDEAAKGIPPAKYLRAQVEGGERRHKRFEMALVRAGIMRPDEYAVPAIGYQRDAYGNIPGSTIVRVLSQLKAFAEQGHKANETARSRKRNLKKGNSRYFIPRGFKAEKGMGRLPRGIYERHGLAVRAIFLFVRKPHYRKRYDFGQAAMTKAARVFAPHWTRYFYVELGKLTRSGR